MDSANNHLLVLDENTLIAVEIGTRHRSVFSDSATNVRGIALDSAGDRLLMVRDSVLLAVSLGSADQTIISDSVTGSGPVINPSAIALDSANNRVLIVNSFPDGSLPPVYDFGVLAVDLTTGDRSALLGGGLISSGLSDLQSIAIDSANNRALIVDDVSGAAAVKVVDLTNGNLSVLSDADFGAGPVLKNPRGIVVDDENHRALMLDSALKALLLIDLTTGDRAIASQ